MGVGVMGMAVGTRFFSVNDPNIFDGKGLKSGSDQALGVPIPYAATINIGIPSRKAFRHFIDIAQLTGALALNVPDVTQYSEGDELFLMVTADGTARTITWGTNIRAGVAATWVIPISGSGVAHMMFSNAKWHVVAQTML